MRFIEVKEIPENGGKGSKKRVSYHRLDKELEEFMRMNVKYAKVVFGENEYANSNACRNNMKRACKYHGYPIKTIERGHDIYFMRTDI